MFQEYEKGPDVPRGLPIIPEAYTPKLKRVNQTNYGNGYRFG